MIKFLIAVAVGYVIWKILSGTIRMLAVEPDAPDPDDVVPTEEHFRCIVCGSEATMTLRSATEAAAPRHCRESMEPIWRA